MPSSSSLPPTPTSLPVAEVLPQVRRALTDHGLVVLDAPPGAGKTTLLPLDLLQHGLEGRLVVLEPRRVAARAAAQRLAEQLGERPGGRVGFTTRDERRTSRSTRIEVVTEGVLLRRLQRDPALSGVGTLVFDEFHERNLEADLALAFALESRAALRPDLRIVVASATLDGAAVSRLLGEAPVVTARGRVHPVEVEHRARPSDAGLAGAVTDAVADLLATTPGDVLVFLPGAREIRRTVERLNDAALTGEPRVLPLHGSLPAADQDAAIRPDPDGRRRVVVSTDLAESSLTIEGVTGVVDAGLSREPRFDATTGMTGLVTVPASRSAAEQRAGRAGRTAPGCAIRLWPEREHAGRDAAPRPAIATDDLTAAALEVAAWGAEVAELALLDAPPPAAWQRAQQTLEHLGALRDGRITVHGRELARLPLHPRLGHLLIRGAEQGAAALAADVAAVLADRDVFVTSPEVPCADLVARVRALRGEPAPAGLRVRRAALQRARRESARLRTLVTGRAADVGDAGDVGHEEEDARGEGDVRDVKDAVVARGAGGQRSGRGTVAVDDPERAGRLVALGWPERIAGARQGRRGTFLLAGGRGAVLPDGDPLAGEPWLAVATLDRGQADARIHLAAPLDAADLLDVAGDAMTRVDEVAWRDGDIVAERRQELGALVVAREPLVDPDPDALLDALLDGIGSDGLDLLDRRDDDRQLQARVALLRRTAGDDWPDLSDDALTAAAERIIGPFLLGARRRADLRNIRVDAVLRSQLTPKQLAALDELAPTHLVVPSGSRIRLDYTAGERPVLAVRVQELFGATTTPTIVGGRVRVLLHLLSPARRPVQVTDDLAGFWTRGYPEVRTELRGRYPKHAWPEDPIAAAPTSRTKRRS